MFKKTVEVVNSHQIVKKKITPITLLTMSTKNLDLVLFKLPVSGKDSHTYLGHLVS